MTGVGLGRRQKTLLLALLATVVWVWAFWRILPRAFPMRSPSAESSPSATRAVRGISPTAPTSRINIQFFSPRSLTPARSHQNVVLSADRSTIAWFSDGRLWVQRMPDGARTPITAVCPPEDVGELVVSRDGQRLAFRDQAITHGRAGMREEVFLHIWDVPRQDRVHARENSQLTSPKETARSATAAYDLAISPDGRFILAHTPSALLQFDIKMRRWHTLFSTKGLAAFPAFARWSPDGGHVLLHLTYEGEEGRGTPVVLDAGGRTVFLVRDVHANEPAKWSANGDAIVFVGHRDDQPDADGLLVHRLKQRDLRLLQVREEGRPEPLPAPGVWDWSPDGGEFVTGVGLGSLADRTNEGDRALLRVSWPAGRVLQRYPLAKLYRGWPARLGTTRYSPDGSRIAVVAGPAVTNSYRSDILLFDRGGGWRNLTEADEEGLYGLIGWVDGRRLLVTVRRFGGNERHLALLTI
jgi:dipeptidyl aminopeptidase/acylaminoacyl peptidase